MAKIELQQALIHKGDLVNYTLSDFKPGVVVSVLCYTWKKTPLGGKRRIVIYVGQIDTSKGTTGKFRIPPTARTGFYDLQASAGWDMASLEIQVD